MRNQKSEHTLDYKAALAIVLEHGFWVVQKRAKKTGEWQTQGGRIRGRQKATETLNEVKEKDRHGYEWRVQQEVLAQAYAQGWKDHEAFADGTYVPYDEVA